MIVSIRLPSHLRRKKLVLDYLDYPKLAVILSLQIQLERLLLLFMAQTRHIYDQILPIGDPQTQQVLGVDDRAPCAHLCDALPLIWSTANLLSYDALTHGVLNRRDSRDAAILDGHPRDTHDSINADDGIPPDLRVNSVQGALIHGSVLVPQQPHGNDEVNHGGDGDDVYDAHPQRSIELALEAGYSKQSHVRTHRKVKELGSNDDSGLKIYHYRSSQRGQSLILSQHHDATASSDGHCDSITPHEALCTHVDDAIHARNVYHRSGDNPSINVVAPHDGLLQQTLHARDLKLLHHYGSLPLISDHIAQQEPAMIMTVHLDERGFFRSHLGRQFSVQPSTFAPLPFHGQPFHQCFSSVCCRFLQMICVSTSQISFAFLNYQGSKREHRGSRDVSWLLLS